MDKKQVIPDTPSLYSELLAAGVPMDHHESDLYVKLTTVSAGIIRAYEIGKHAHPFVSQQDGSVWYEVPFAYLPFWEAVERRSDGGKR